MGYMERLAVCPCLGLRKASRAITAMYNEHMSPSGVLITQLPMLGALKVEGSLPLTRLAEVLGMDRTTLSRNVNPMLRQGLVAEGTGQDKRSRILTITDQGAKALELALPLWDEAQDKVRAILGKAGTEVLLDKLKALA